MDDKVVRIGCAAGYWGDTQTAPRQLVELGNIDYLVFDYLAEITMSILARAHARSDDGGYAIDFVALVMKPLIKQIAEKGIKVVANAGGVNLEACRAALAKVAEEAGVRLKIGVVTGDDLLPRESELRARDLKEMFSGEAMPERVMSMNAYLGALPIAAALDAGADVVVTGRCVDSAVTLGPLVHEFGWSADDYDRLAAGTLAGHLIECGAQCTGGNFTDWRDVADDWDDMGYPITECRADGSFVLTKPEGTGGLVSPFTAGEQMLYEIGDPQGYIVPDVVCDFSHVTMEQVGKDRVLVKGARGYAPTSTYKVSTTYHDGYRTTGIFTIAGFDAAEKARRDLEALLAKSRRLLRERGLGDFRKTAQHLIGAETLFGDNARPEAVETREVVARVDVQHENRDALELFSKEATGTGLCMSTGRCSAGAAGRPKVTPVVRLFSFLIDKRDVDVGVNVDGQDVPVTVPAEGGYDPARVAKNQTPAGGAVLPEGPTTTVPLIRLAVARSGDKGNDANIGIMARRDEYLPAIRQVLTEAEVARRFSHVLKGGVERFELPGIHGLNFLLHDTLDGGGPASSHLDHQAKTYGQQILSCPIEVPQSWIEDL
jgi:hypothetical protein